MEIIYLSNNKKKIKRVYGKEIFSYTKESLIQSGKTDTEIIFSTWGMPQFTEEEIKKYLPRLKAIFYAAGSVQAFARPFLRCGVRVFSAWQANAVPVVEYAVSQILLANKGFFLAARNCKLSYKKAHQFAERHIGNYRAKIGIIGYGAIGSKVVQELLSHQVDIYVFAPNLTQEEAEKLGIHKASLEYIFENCHVISNHVANVPQTVGMITRQHLEKMQDFSTFINTGRGAQVDEKALQRVLLRNKTITAVLDVTDRTYLFWCLRNAVLTPHIAGSMGREVERMAQYMKDTYDLFIQGQPCPYEVTLPMLETMA